MPHRTRMMAVGTAVVAATTIAGTAAASACPTTSVPAPGKSITCFVPMTGGRSAPVEGAEGAVDGSVRVEMPGLPVGGGKGAVDRSVSVEKPGLPAGDGKVVVLKVRSGGSEAPMLACSISFRENAPSGMFERTFAARLGVGRGRADKTLIALADLAGPGVGGVSSSGGGVTVVDAASSGFTGVARSAGVTPTKLVGALEGTAQAVGGQASPS